MASHGKKASEGSNAKTEILVRDRCELETSWKRYETLYDAAPVGFITLAGNGVIREMNLTAARLLNRARANTIGRSLAEFVAENDRKKFFDHLMRCHANSQSVHPYYVELRMLPEGYDNPIRAELLTMAAGADHGGEVLYQSVLRDITAFKQMQDVQRWLAAIVESTDDAVIGVDLKGRVISSNKGASQLYGYQPSELLGKVVTILTPPEFQSRESKILFRALQGETIDHYETVRQHKNGSRVEISLTISPIRDAHGKIIGASKIARDITGKKRSEKELAESLAREQAANRAKDGFLAGLSHELRTPLSPVLLLASDCAKDPDLPPRARANFDTIRKNVELEARLIDDLLDLTRITHGKLILNKTPVDVQDLLNDAISTVRTELAQKQIVLELKFHAANHRVFGDAVRIQQIFWNVIKNAVKFTSDGGRITVQTRTTMDGDRLLIDITDTGIGMDAQETECAFNAFSQGRHLFGGLGLGLAISRALVELHRGAIRASSPGKGKGSTFSIELPLLKTADLAKADSSRTPANLPPPPPPPRNNTVNILLVEDHESTRRALTQLLLRHRYKVTNAASLAEARSLMEANPNFNLLISDIGLPDGTGYDLMIEFKRRFGASGIALTGYGMEQDVAHSRNAGFATHLTKPVRIEALESALAATLNRS